MVIRTFRFILLFFNQNTVTTLADKITWLTKMAKLRSNMIAGFPFFMSNLKCQSNMATQLNNN